MIYILLFLFSASAFAPALNIRQTAMLETLNQIHSLYMQQYAPLIWKDEQKPNQIEDQFRLIYHAIQDDPNMSKDQFRQYLFEFIHTTRDYHVQIEFFSTESSMLPITLRSEEGRIFVVYIEPEVKDDPIYQDVEIGDEIIGWNGRPAIDVLNEIIAKIASNNPGTDRRIAEIKMTTRLKSHRSEIPVGDVIVDFKRSQEDGSKVFTKALTWKHIPEYVPQELSIFDSLLHLAGFTVPTNNTSYFSKLIGRESRLRNKVYRSRTEEENPYSLGARDSFVPTLGKVIWKNADDNPFKSYIYRNENNHLIGYLRIPNYLFCSRQDLEAFDETINELESKTDALVIDQVANPGGRLYFSYAVVSRFIDKPVRVLPHKIVLTESTAYRAYQQLNDIEKISRVPNLTAILNMEDSCGMEAGPNFFYGLKEFNLFILDQLKKGLHLSEPVAIDGIANLNPHSKVRYTKPKLMLIEHLDVSAADFVPAMFQDSKALTLFGSSTSGAGGMVSEFEPPNQFGISMVTFTTSQGIRKDGRPLENNGVAPDIKYDITPKDLQDSYQDYKTAVNKAISGLVNENYQSK